MGRHRPPDPGGAFIFLIAIAAVTSAVTSAALVEDVTASTRTATPTSPKYAHGDVLLEVGEPIKEIVDPSLILSESLIEVDDANNQTEGSARRRRRRRRRRRAKKAGSTRRRSNAPAPAPRPRPTPRPRPRPRPSPRPRPRASPPAPTGPRPSDSNLAAILDRHNKYRCMHGVQSLKWNDAIARNAASWAKATGGRMKHSSSQSRKGIGGFSYLGENLASGATGTRGVDMWYDEIKLTPGGRVTSFGSGTGHYTQVVWKQTSDLGCAVNGRLLVCQYGIGGNMGGQFSNNVNGPVKSSGQCPDGASGGGGGASPSGGGGAAPAPKPLPSGGTFIEAASESQVQQCVSSGPRCILYFGSPG